MLGLIKKCPQNLKRWIFLSITLLGLGFANNLALAASLAQLPTINSIDGYGELNGKLYFHGFSNGGASGGLWVTDGTISGTQLLTENLSTFVRDFVAFDGKLYFSADDGTHGYELWVTDGSSSGTHLLKDINPQALSHSFPAGFTELNGKLYFAADDGAHGSELWVTDGSPAGTVLAHDTYPGALGGLAGSLAAFNGSLYYFAANGVNYDLWRMDSSTNGTQVLASISANPYQTLVSLNNKLYFSVHDNPSAYGDSLWETDGTIGGTQQVASTSILGPLVELNDKLYFIDHDGSRGSLWETNGTASGTKLLEGSVYVLPHLVRFRNRLLFMDYDGSDGRNLWSTDGSNSGTQLLLDIIASHGTLNRDSFGRGVLKNKFYFTVLEPTYGSEVWETDGSENGTRLVKDLSATVAPGSDVLTTFAGKVVISAYDESYVQSFWILTPLTLTTTSPTAGESDVPLNTSHLTLSFNEAVSAGSGNIKIIKSSDHTVVASYSIADLTPDGVVINGTNVTIPLRAGLLEPKTSYYVTINAGVFIGGESEPYPDPAITDANTWSFTTAKGTQGITFAADTPTTKPLTDLPFAVTATGGNSGQPVLITSGTPQVCNIISGKVELLSTGTCTLTANQAGNEQYHAAASVNFEITVTAATKTDQVISFDPQTPTSKTLGDEPFAVLATGGASGNPVVITSSTSSVCTIFNTTVTLVSVGTCTLTANQLGNTNYNAALPVSMNISVTAATKTDQVISFDPQTPTSKTLGDEPFAVLATGGASGNPVVITSSTSSVCSITNNTVTVLNVGICALTANQAGNATYNPAVPVNKDITVSAVTQGSVGDIRLTINKGHLVDLKLETMSSYVIGRPDDMHFIDAYSYRIIGLSTTELETVTITLTFNSSIPSGAKLYKVTSSGYKEITGVAINNNAATFSITDGNSFDADGVHNGIIIDPIALGIPPTTVVKIDQSISFSSSTPTTKQLGDTPFTITAKGGGSGNPVVITSSTPNICNVSVSTITLVAIGNCILIANQAGNDRYNPAMPATTTILVTQASKTDQIIKFTSSIPTNKVLGDAPFGIMVSGGASGNPVILSSSNSSICSVSGHTVTLLAVGVCTLTANQAGNDSYNPAVTVSINITVHEPVINPPTDNGLFSQIITFINPPVNKVFRDLPFAIKVTGGNSGNPVIINSNTPITCSVSGSIVTILAAGNCTLSATQAGNASYLAAQASYSFVIAQASQVISFNSPDKIIFRIQPWQIRAKGGLSGNPVIFKSHSPNFCRVINGKVIFMQLGTCVLVADQAGTLNYQAAPSVVKKIQIVGIKQGKLNRTAIKISNGHLHQFKKISLSNYILGRPKDKKFTFGAYQQKIFGLSHTQAQSVIITLKFKEGLPENVVVYNVNKSGYTTIHGATLQGNMVTFQVYDGGVLDADGVVDGRITNLTTIGVAMH